MQILLGRTFQTTASDWPRPSTRDFATARRDMFQLQRALDTPSTGGSVQASTRLCTTSTESHASPFMSLASHRSSGPAGDRLPIVSCTYMQDMPFKASRLHAETAQKRDMDMDMGRRSNLASSIRSGAGGRPRWGAVKLGVRVVAVPASLSYTVTVHVVSVVPCTV